MSLTRNPSFTMLSEPVTTRMFNKILLCSLSLGAAFGVVLMSHAADTIKADMSKVPPASDKKGLTFDKDIKPILDKSCVKCHGADKPKSKYRVDSVAAVIKGGESGDPAVVAGH